MHEAIEPFFAAWESYYVIIGSSAAALTGLQFVVMALVADTQVRSTPDTVGAFGTPTIVHFCSALLVSAVLSAPWHVRFGVATIFVLAGLFGLGYTTVVTLRARRQEGYKPVFEDWLWHAALPFIAYAILLISAIALPRHEENALFTIAGVKLLLLFIGIHNSWDSVIYITMLKKQFEERTPRAEPGGQQAAVQRQSAQPSPATQAASQAATQ